MASVYFRIKDGQTWRYRAIGRGRPPKGAKFHVRYTDVRKKQTWSQPYDTVEEAQEAAANIGTILDAQARGLTVAEASNAANVNRKTIKPRLRNSSTSIAVCARGAFRLTPLA